MDTNTKTLFVVNPQSAGGKTRTEWPRIEKLAKKILGDVTTYTTERPNHATELTRRGLQEGFGLVVSVGGDGTNNEVINGFFDEEGNVINPSASFGLIPRGTGCDLARNFKISKDSKEALERLKGNDQPVDIGRIGFTDHDGKPATRHFINVAGCGASGDVVNRVNRSSKRLGGFATFLLATLSSILSYDNQKVVYRLDDGPEATDLINTIFVCNARYAGGGMIVGPDAKIEDGLFDISIIRDISRIGALTSARYLYSGRMYDHPKIQHFRAKKIEVRAAKEQDSVLLEVDGEQPGCLPATYEVLPGAIKLRS